MTNPDSIDDPQDVLHSPGAAFQNPFEGGAQVIQRPRELDLGAGALGGANILIPPATVPQDHESYPQDAEVFSDAKEAAVVACGQVAECYIEEKDASHIQFPRCSDLAAISEVLKEIMNTPLGLGYGPLPDGIQQALRRFSNEVAAAYREDRKLGAATLIPLDIELPPWLESNPNFDILADIKLADVTVHGRVQSVIAARAQHCKITFADEVSQSANVGYQAQHCTVIFDEVMSSDRSFRDAKNCTVRFNKGHTSGFIGPMTTSRVECSGRWGGIFYHTGSSIWTTGVEARVAT